ncbi:hypothetical protein [Aliiroseovarius sp.]|uniref:hypothetical protein n=1 Tax=Aliiroseovarius sp. TaxID=1872442 RepID=UPI003BAD232E
MKFIRFVLGLVSDILGQLLTGIGLMIVLGSFVAEIYIMVAVGIVLMVIGFFLFRST